MPGSFQASSGGVPNVARGVPAVRGFMSGDSPYFEYPYAISGITKDSTGAPLPSCSVKLYRTADDSVAGLAVSDASGAYSISASGVLAHYAVAYLPGSPDVAGTTVNTLVGA